MLMPFQINRLDLSAIRGYIIDNEIDYPGGNDHGSVVQIHDQWYIFYHKMTNGTIFSRRGCVEPITLDDDGKFSTVEMTSLGFSKALYPFEITQAEYACVLKTDRLLQKKMYWNVVMTHILDGSVIGYKYFDFGEDHASKTMEFAIKTDGRGCDSEIHIHLDSEDGKEIGTCLIGKEDGVYTTVVERPTGRHAIYFTVQTSYQKMAGRQPFLKDVNSLQCTHSHSCSKEPFSHLPCQLCHPYIASTQYLSS